MSMIQPNTHVFIVKVWLDHGAEQVQPAVWRGRITHVPSGQEGHFTALADVPKFIDPYLREMGATPTLFGKIRYWCARRFR